MDLLTQPTTSLIVPVAAGSLRVGDTVFEAGDGVAFDVVAVETVGGRTTVTLKSDFLISCRGNQVLEVAADQLVAAVRAA